MEKSLPPPSLLILYPTYRCSNIRPEETNTRLCPNCIYASFLGDRDLDLEVAVRVVHEAVEMGVRNLQLSGGGEPLQYRHIQALLDVFESQQSAIPELELGLITNGLHMNHQLAARIARQFSYVRLSLSEGYVSGSLTTAAFMANFRGFLEEAMAAPQVRVGLKLLLKHGNAQNLAKTLEDLANSVGNTLLKRLDHLRVKAMRSIDSQMEPTDEDRHLFLTELNKLISGGERRWPRDIQVDLDLGYVVADFQCLLNPLCAVVDPNCALMACYNYVEAYEALKIGDLRSTSFRSLWGGQRHQEVVQKLDCTIVCNSRRGCPCRFIKYQEQFESSQPSDVPETPSKVTRLL